MSSRNHSNFLDAKNQFHPCKTIKVNKTQNWQTSPLSRKPLPLSLSLILVGEKIEIPMTMAYVTLEGAGAGKTIIRWDDTADRVGPNGQPLEQSTTSTSRSHRKAGSGSADICRHGAFINCKFVGAQDTLYDHKGRHYFKNCHIQGSVDFIFGDGLSLYQDCHLHAKAKSYGALTAQKRESMLEETGFSFVNCKVTGSGALYLGRAWGTFSRVVFAYTYMDKIITPRGWYDWGDKQRQMTVFYGNSSVRDQGRNMEAGCHGQGSSPNRRLSHLYHLASLMDTNGSLISDYLLLHITTYSSEGNVT
ncbi:putative pectinesterase 53 [Sesamum angolense]|uniref:Pectinesterase n=1 Tax=Sesamum angolense TaxID=2727404 RepID=A0AAE1XHL7_9LAMI|nr:putative pectinesterase 53 [Sesamum angolense]